MPGHNNSLLAWAHLCCHKQWMILLELPCDCSGPPLLERHCKKELQDPSSKSPPLCPPLACWTSHHLPARHPTICLLDITCDQFSRGLPLCVYKLCKPGRSGKGEVTFLLVRGQIVCLGLWAVLGGWLMSAELSAWAVPVSSFVQIVCNWAGLANLNRGYCTYQISTFLDETT